MKRYRFVVDAQVIEYFDCLTRRERGRLIDIFDQLAEFPNVEGDTRITDRSGRVNEVKDFGVWRITFWVDGPVHEMRITDVERLSVRTKRRKS
jgi:hypothetical protein